MAHDHSLVTNGVLKHGTTLEQVIKAVEPILQYFGYYGQDEGQHAFAGQGTGDDEFNFDPATGELYIYTCGDVNDSYIDLVRNVAENLGTLTKVPGHFNLSDHDTADLDNAKQRIYYGGEEDSGAYEKIRSVLMQDFVGDYDTPDQVPEWSWVERVASYAHAKNGQDGIWEFVLNLSLGWDDVPDRLLPIISKAKAGNIAYLIFHQGT